jgi:hypothetical protein
VTEKTRAYKAEHPLDEGQDSEMIVNDSLGTVDLADSTGTDSNKKVEAEKAERTMDKRHGKTVVSGQ